MPEEKAIDGFFVKPSESFLDKVTSEENLIKSQDKLSDVTEVPDLRDRFDAIKELQDIHDSLATYTNWGRVHAGGEHYKRVASIPAPVLDAAIQIEPDLLLNKKKFYAWLDKHPGYQTVRRRRANATQEKRQANS